MQKGTASAAELVTGYTFDTSARDIIPFVTVLAISRQLKTHKAREEPEVRYNVNHNSSLPRRKI